MKNWIGIFEHKSQCLFPCQPVQATIRFRCVYWWTFKCLYFLYTFYFYPDCLLILWMLSMKSIWLQLRLSVILLRFPQNYVWVARTLAFSALSKALTWLLHICDKAYEFAVNWGWILDHFVSVMYFEWINAILYVEFWNYSEI